MIEIYQEWYIEVVSYVIKILCYLFEDHFGWSLLVEVHWD